MAASLNKKKQSRSVKKMVSISPRDLVPKDDENYWQPGMTLPKTPPTSFRYTPLPRPPSSFYPSTTPIAVRQHRTLDPDSYSPGLFHTEGLNSDECTFTHHCDEQTDDDDEDDLVDQSESTSNQLGKTLDKILSTQQKILRRLTALESTPTSSSSSTSSDSPQGKTKRLPSELCSKVASIYSSIPCDQMFDLTQKYSHTSNQSTKGFIKDQILAEKENVFNSLLVDTAIQRYFHSRKRNKRESLPDQKERVQHQEKQRKIRSRRQRLFDRRKKQVRHGKEMERWNKLSIDYMSLESTDDDDIDKLVVHHLPWRSKKLTEFVKVLDKRADEAAKSTKHHVAKAKQRIEGTVAQSSPPVNAPPWAVDKEWKNDVSHTKPPSDEEGENASQFDFSSQDEGEN